MQILHLQGCLGLTKPDRQYHVSAGEINPKTGKAYAINPGSGNWDDNYFANTYANNPANNYGNAGATASPDQIAQQSIDSARKIRDFTIESNQPAIQSYEQSKSPLQDRYKNLLQTIKGNQQVAENRQTTTTNNEMGRRGISNDSGVYQQEMTNAVNPVTQQYTGMYQDANAQQGIDMSNIDKAIAMLKAGNPEGAISGGLNISANIQQAEQAARNAQMQQEQFSQSAAMQQAAQALQERQFNEVTLPSSQYELNKPYYKPSIGATGSGIDLSGLSQLFGGTPQTNSSLSTPKSFQPTTTSTSQKPGQTMYTTYG